MKENASKYLICLLTPVVVAAILLSLSWGFLWRAGEYRSMDEIVERQMAQGGLYNSAIEQTSFGYKQALYTKTKPRIAALGSSRVMQFQGEAFNTSFVTMGGAAGGLLELQKAIEEMLAGHEPDLLMVGLDFWWFCDSYIEPASGMANRRFLTQVKPRLSHLLEPYKWLLAGKIRPVQIGQVLAAAPRHQGVAPIIRGDGYDVHGAYHYVQTTSQPASPDETFNWDRERAERGDRTYSFCDKVSSERWEEFEKAVRLLEDTNINFILFLPPLAPDIYAYLKNSGRHGYIEGLRQRLAEYKYPVYDYHDPDILGGDPCEFIDALHAGPIFYRRILLDMAMRESSRLAPYVEVNRLFEDIQEYHGRATLWPEGMFPDRKEMDFLGIGCIRN